MNLKIAKMKGLKKNLSILLTLSLIMSMVLTPTKVAATNSFTNAQAIQVNQNVSVSVTSANQKLYYSFTPTATGFYTIESFNNGISNPFAWLYNPGQSEIFQNDNCTISNINFKITYHLDANQKYYIAVGCSGSGTGSYQFKIVSTTNLNGHSVFSLPTSILPGTMAPPSGNVDVARKRAFFQYTPTVTGSYVFNSFGGTNNPQGWLYNSNGSFIDSKRGNLDYGGPQFQITATLTAGQTYYLAVGYPNNDTGTFMISTQNYIVSFNPNGGSVSPTSKAVARNTAIGTLPTPTKTSKVTFKVNYGSNNTHEEKNVQWVFDGWYTALSGGTKVNENTVITGNMTLYARWTSPKIGTLPTTNPIRESTVTFNYNGGTGSLASRDVQWGFKGWYTSSSGGTQVTANTPITGSTTIYAQWNKPKIGTLPATTRNSALSFNFNGGNGSPPANPNVSWSLKGWYTSSTGTTTVNANTEIEGNTTIFAQWNNPTVGSKLPAIPTKNNNLFSGWYTASSGGTKINANTTITSNAPTYHAQWKPTTLWHENSDPGDENKNKVGFWDMQTVNVHITNLSSGFDLTAGMNEARAQWSNALGISINNTSSAQNAQIKAYSGTAAALQQILGKWDGNWNGYADTWSYPIGNVTIGGINREIRKLTDATTIYVRDDLSNTNEVKMVTTHELGHALGFFGHPAEIPANSQDVMWRWKHSYFTVRANERSHLKQIYDNYRS